MATDERAVFLFPGQGAYRPGALGALVTRHYAAARVVAEIDEVAVALRAETLSERVAATDGPDVDTLLREAPDLLQLALFGTSVAAHAVAREQRPAPSAVMGHSLGEVAALVAGGVLDVAQGAEAVITRNAVLRGLGAPDGGMAALACDAGRAQQLLDLVGDPWSAVAAENGPQQTVVSGPAATITTVAAVAAALRVGCALLPAPYPFHSPVLSAGVADFAGRVAHLRQGPATTPVYSPTLGRYLRADDRVADVLSGALVHRVGFATAVTRLAAAGARSFVECGPGEGLARLVQRLVPSASAVSALAESDGFSLPQQRGAAPAAVAPAAVAPAAVTPLPPAAVTPLPPAAAPAAVSGLPGTREEVFADLRRLYAEALEYPEEVFDDDVVLEGDLGVDSVKQTELLGRAADRYAMPERPQDFRLSDYDTMGKVVDYVWSVRGTTGAEREARGAAA